MRRARGRKFALAALVLVILAIGALLSGASVEARAPVSDAIARIDVLAKAIPVFSTGDPARDRFGALRFRGGLELSSSFRGFGGLSALRVEADGAHFLTLSDKGRWFRGRIVYQNGAPAEVADVETAPILGPDGRPLAQRGWFDTESIASDGDTLYVGVERVNRIVRFDYRKDGLRARGRPIPVPLGVERLPYNKGLEAMAFVPVGLLGGTLIALSERGLDAAGNLNAFLIGGASPGTFTVKRHDEFDISDAALLPPGDLLLLERRFNWVTGIAMRIRRVALADVRPGALVDGPLLIEADMRHQIDNMEGLAVHRGSAGETVLTLVSDDNFAALQRTLLLQFTLAE